MTSSATHAARRTSASTRHLQESKRHRFRRMMFESLEDRRVMATFPAPVEDWQQADFVNGQIMVRFQSQVTQQEATSLLFSRGAYVNQYWPELNLYFAQLVVQTGQTGGHTRQSTIEAAANIHALDIVEYAEPNFMYRWTQVPNDPLFIDQWGHNNVGQNSPFPLFFGGTFDADIDAVEAWDTITGDPNVVVAIMDSGVDLGHPDLVDNLWTNPNETPDGIDNDGNGFIDDVIGWDTFDNDNDPSDVFGHGTHVAGIAGAVGNNNVGVTGVGWNNKILAMKIGNVQGASTAGIVGGQVYIRRMKVQFGVNIVVSNNSYGGPTFSFAQFDAIRLATQAGIGFVAAAGNNGLNIDSPANQFYPNNYNIPGIISVAATDRDDVISTLSNRGFFNVDLAAPGEEILSTMPTYLPPIGTQPPAPNVPPPGYGWLDGTSMAAPMVAGAYGVIKAFDPTLTVAQVKNILMTTVDRVPSLRNVTASGGRLNLRKAIDAIPVNEFFGTVFLDRDGDGRFDGNEPGQSGWTVYVDLNNNKSLDAGEPQTVSQADGTYRLRAKLVAGNYFIREVVQPGFIQTKPNAVSDFAYRVTLTGPLDQVSGLDFGNKPIPGSVEGEKYNDLNGNGQRDPGEPGFKGVVIYVDVNNDGKIGVGEPGAITDVNGRFRIDNVLPGVYTVREVYQPGMVQTEPDPSLPASGGIPNVLVVGGQVTSGLLFGNRAAFDYGDAPESYRTLKADNGPVHGVLRGFHLGSRVDDEADGTPTPNATGDDIDRANDDEDGVIFLTPLTPGEVASIAVQVNTATYGTGVLAGWIDFNNDGDFLDGGEQIIADRRLRTGQHIINFTVPANAAVGDLLARFRLSTQLGLGPIGPAIAGEVEDYVTGAASSTPFAKDDTLVTDQDTDFDVNPIFVLANDVRALNGLPLSIATFDAVTVQGGQVRIDDNGTPADTTDDFLEYKPRPGFFGPDSFTYTATDGINVSNTATVSITVRFVPTDPVAIDDTFDLQPGSGGIVLDVLANDIQGTAGALSLQPASFTTAAGGQVQITSSTVTYTRPSPSFTGSDTFNYTVRDPANKTDTAQVWIQVGGPVAGVHKILVEFRLFDKDGNQLQEGAVVPVGETIEVRALTQDLRGSFQDPVTLQEAAGTLAAYVDTIYNRDVVQVKADPANTCGGVDITWGPRYGGGVPCTPPDDFLRVVNTGIPGLVDETGGTTGTQTLNLGAGLLTLYRLKFVATAQGTVQFKANPADGTPAHDVLANVLINNGTNITVAPIPDNEVFLRSSPTITIIGAGEGEGTNMRHPLDVNDDGWVSAIDALLVISHVNRFGAGPYSPSLFAAGGQLVPQYYVDVNYDGNVSAIDIKLVIDYLNSHPVGGGEGEAEGEGGDGFAAAFAPSMPGSSSSKGAGTANSASDNYADDVDRLFIDDSWRQPAKRPATITSDDADDVEEEDDFFRELGSWLN